MGCCFSADASSNASSYHDSLDLSHREKVAYGDTPIATPPRLGSKCTLADAEKDYVHAVATGGAPLLERPPPVTLLTSRNGESPQRLSLQPEMLRPHNRNKFAKHSNFCDDFCKQCFGGGYDGRTTKTGRLYRKYTPYAHEVWEHNPKDPRDEWIERLRNEYRNY